jgi:hypothetical protein
MRQLFTKENEMKWILALVLIVAGLFSFGCSKEPDTQPETPPVVADGSKYLLAAEPEGAQGVIEARKNVEDGDLLAVVGRIGGSAKPWVEGRAAFSIVDPSLRACSDIEGDECELPWDYCCETDRLPGATALVKVTDESGDLIAVDARQLLKVKELQTVVVQGKAQRDDAGNLTILASGMYLKP